MVPDYAWSKADLDLFTAVWNGQADAHAQRRVITHIVEMLCGTNRISFVAGSPDMTAFNEGRRWVARQLQNAITLPVDRLVKEEPDERRIRPATATERANSPTAPGVAGARARRASSKQPA